MRTLIVLSLLMGCAMGQDSTVCLNKHLGSKGLTDVERCFLSHPGDCYRVKQDGTLEKVGACYNTKELVTWDSITTTPILTEPVDVPAIRSSVDEVFCNAMMGYSCTFTARDKWSCADKSSILLTSEDGKHWCHKVQP